MSIENLIASVTDGFKPHPWQNALAGEVQITNRLIRIPTGMGKTLGVLSTWLKHRVIDNDTAWPTRLVWCLPMRTLVEQTESEAHKLIDALSLRESVDVHVLMGGVDTSRWYDHPGKTAILIGTQDMLLSRALNRGYAMGRAAWPRAFGLLNSDSLWVMDEVQLMGVGLTTSAQIQAFWDADQKAKTTTEKPRVTWWMSATLQPDWLRSPETESLVDSLSDNILRVEPTDRNGLQWEASKTLTHIPLEENKKPADCADLILEKHLRHESNSKYGRQTLVVLNTVKQARELFSNLTKLLKKQEGDDEIEAHLIHSRFRPADREDWINRFLSRETLKTDTNRILVATQVVEAGVDISATCLVTELAPWPSLVQRFGRAARYGGASEILVLDPQHTDDKKSAPYLVEELDAARAAIQEIDDVAIGSLEDFESGLDEERIKQLYPFHPLHVILQSEFEELFDTSPDLSGADVDVSRFIREGEDRDVKVFWRSWDDDKPNTDIRAQRRELCSAPIGDAKTWIKKDHVKKEAWTWDYLDGVWIKADANRLKPGQILLVPPSVGGYDSALGFTGDKPRKKDPLVEEVAIFESDIASASNDAADDSESNDDLSSCEVWKTIATHCQEAADVGVSLLKELEVDERLARIVRLALRLHDWGKAHPAFATGTYRVTPDRADLAKAPDKAWRAKNQIYRTDTHGPRRGFRHELASCLAVLELLRTADAMHPAILGRHEAMLVACGIEPELPTQTIGGNSIADELKSLSESEFNLLLYLIASHHGKVRVSMQASPIDQDFPFDNDQYAGTGMPIRGVREGDVIPEVDLPSASDKITMPEMTISLSPAAMGLSAAYGASWSERVHGLMQEFGPFTLSWLEAVIRSADGRASDDGQPPGNKPDPLLRGIVLSVPDSIETGAVDAMDVNDQEEISIDSMEDEAANV